MMSTLIRKQRPSWHHFLLFSIVLYCFVPTHSCGGRSHVLGLNDTLGYHRSIRVVCSPWRWLETFTWLVSTYPHCKSITISADRCRWNVAEDFFWSPLFLLTLCHIFLLVLSSQLPIFSWHTLKIFKYPSSCECCFWSLPIHVKLTWDKFPMTIKK